MISTIDNSEEDKNPSSRNFGTSKLNYKFSAQMSGNLHFCWSVTFLESENFENPSSRTFGEQKAPEQNDIYYVK